MGLGPWEIGLIIIVIIILFGGKKLPELARGLGLGLREFQKATREIKDEVKSVADDVEDLPFDGGLLVEVVFVALQLEGDVGLVAHHSVGACADGEIGRPVLVEGRRKLLLGIGYPVFGEGVEPSGKGTRLSGCRTTSPRPSTRCPFRWGNRGRIGRRDSTRKASSGGYWRGWDFRS